MFGLDPFNPSIAITEIVLLLALAAIVGWLLGRLVLNGRIKALRTNIADREAELNNVRQSETTVLPANTEPLVPVTPITGSHAKPIIETNAIPNSSNSSDSTRILSDKGIGGKQILAKEETHTEVPSRNDEQTNALKTVEESIPVASTTATRATTGQDMMDPSIRSGLDMDNTSKQGQSSLNTSIPGTSIPGTSEAAVLSRIAARSHEVNFDRIGRATAAEADDLKDIIGIGPFLERKLNAIGIYTYRQVANFTREDAETVNRIIEFFPGRIERDNWVDQSQAFHERKYGARG